MCLCVCVCDMKIIYDSKTGTLLLLLLLLYVTSLLLLLKVGVRRSTLGQSYLLSPLKHWEKVNKRKDYKKKRACVYFKQAVTNNVYKKKVL